MAVEFKPGMADDQVLVNGKPLGYISRSRGEFFTDPTVIKSFTTVTAQDLRKIADQIDIKNGVKGVDKP